MNGVRAWREFVGTATLEHELMLWTTGLQRLESESTP